MWKDLEIYSGKVVNNAISQAVQVGTAYGMSYVNMFDGGSRRLITPARYSGNIIVFEARRTAVQIAQKAVDDAINYGYKKIREAQWKQRSASIKQVQAAHNKLIEDGEKVDNEQGLGYIYDTQGQRFTAVGKYENHVKDALILSIPGKTILSKQTTTPSGALVKTNVTYDLLIFSDLSAKINMDTAKNLILTKVMGRDRSRKELVSNDDLLFIVQGNVVSDYPDI